MNADGDATFIANLCTGSNCPNLVTRFLWAGDQILWELRAPGGDADNLKATTGTGDQYGRVSYFHAGGIDRPLTITKLGIGTIVTHQNWRGQLASGTWAIAPTGSTAGDRSDCYAGAPSSCAPVNWPGWRTSAYNRDGDNSGVLGDARYWFGSLASGMEDASGQQYMRNRYFDPKTGQFTQANPIGLGGGLNAYGFASGDPVSHSDPYGLRCTPWPACWGTRLRGASGDIQNQLEDIAAEQLASGNTLRGGGAVLASAFMQFAVKRPDAQVHHVATDKNRVSSQRGGPWTPRFEAIFEKAGMSLNDPQNLIEIPGHQDPHPEEYHRVVFDRLVTATEELSGDEYKDALVAELDRMRVELQTPGSDLNKLVTKGH